MGSAQARRTSQGERGEAGCGGLIRNGNCYWVAEFTYRIGTCLAFMDELWGVAKGL
ncbi:hypothetical protein AHAS_Ahas15G0085400 [Arachis hypogaea]